MIVSSCLIGGATCDLDAALVDIASSIRDSYSSIDIDIKPTQISLTLLLSLASVLKKALSNGSQHLDVNSRKADPSRSGECSLHTYIN